MAAHVVNYEEEHVIVVDMGARANTNVPNSINMLLL